MGIPVMKRCCCLELKWGALIAALVDWGLAGTLVGMTNSAAMWYVAVAVHVAHVVGCILVVASVFVFLLYTSGTSSSHGSRSSEVPPQ
ncbi:uncharacterized protein LOC108029761 isoform X4 [Drosophila biarmipes]|uniref:uncharacterized protein LOC108029761 isoform X4 n=1 Tax=Drosophila biarmipes TaxID=125945 RepID=UPI0007E8548B|nr:uncharacterized protein LOC108029761 isoform X4 [Drosophila biarmipes]